MVSAMKIMCRLRRIDVIYLLQTLFHSDISVLGRGGEQVHVQIFIQQMRLLTRYDL